jgi:hypothetical protein
MNDLVQATDPTAANFLAPARQWEFDHERLLYQGGASANVNIPTSVLRLRFGPPKMDRLALALKINDVIEGRLAAGGSQMSAKTTIDKLRRFYSWADASSFCLTLDNVEHQFLKWSEHLVSRARSGAIKELTAYGEACVVSGILDEVLDLKVGLIRQTRLRRKHKHHLGLYRPVNIEHAFLFGQTLCDVCDSLSSSAIRGSLPIQIRFKDGRDMNHWSGLRDIETLKRPPSPFLIPDRSPEILSRRHAWELDNSNRTRQSVINLRIQAEMLIFIAQTGMNPSQVKRLTIGRFSYQSHVDGYVVRRVYKPRKQGEVAFEIYTEYRTFFERYLLWLKEIFPAAEDGLLFPLISNPDSKHRSINGVCENLKGVRGVCKKLGIDFVTPRELRKVRINWLVRRSGDLDQTVEMAQSSKEVLFRNYLQPDAQVAAVEITRFFRQHDESSHSAPGPGLCIDPTPSAIREMPVGMPKPDCISPAGCLFCTHQRDIDSADHVWSLVSYRQLKIMEMAIYRPRARENVLHPASAVVARVTEKISHFEESSKLRQEWVVLAKDKVREGDYHPMWSGFLNLIETQL